MSEGDSVLKSPTIVKSRTMWKWTPATSQVSFLGPYVPVSGLVHVLDGTGYALRWTTPGAEPWNGPIFVRAPEVRRWMPLHIAEFVSAPHDADETKGHSASDQPPDSGQSYNSDLDWIGYILGSDGKSLVMIQGMKKEGDCLRCVSLRDTSQIRWQVTREDIQHVVGREVYGVAPVPGVSGPCDWLPFYVGSLGSDYSAILLVDTSTGNLRQWLYEDRPPFYLYDIAGNGSGRIIAVAQGSTEPRELLLHSTRNPTPIAKQMVCWDHFPAGFSSAGSLILMSSEFVWIVESPYTGKPRAIFSLKRARTVGRQR